MKNKHNNKKIQKNKDMIKLKILNSAKKKKEKSIYTTWQCMYNSGHNLFRFITADCLTNYVISDLSLEASQLWKDKIKV